MVVTGEGNRVPLGLLASIAAPLPTCRGRCAGFAVVSGVQHTLVSFPQRAIADSRCYPHSEQVLVPPLPWVDQRGWPMPLLNTVNPFLVQLGTVD